ncbi:MAG: hypothetical protein E7451_02935 [Ruminococcaceae bacterium]|nr:hypothetical protein [Oscillospiraceae bacterium]
MPQLLSKRIRLMTIYAYLEPISILLGLFFAGLFLVTAFSGQSIWIRIIMAAFGLASIGILIGFDQYLKHLKRQSALSPYCIPIHASDLERLCVMLSAAKVDADGFVSFRKHNGFTIRLLIQYCPEFLPKEVSSRRKVLNKKLNLRFPDSQSGSMHEVLKRMRINLVVCDSLNGHAESWVQRNAAHLLDRNESIVNAVLCQNEQNLLLPAILDSLSLPQLRKYQAAVELLIEHLIPRVDK